MKLKLTKEQKKHLPSLLWLYSGARASGRTTLLAYVLIQSVMETEITQRIVDHYSDRLADARLAEVIQGIINENELPLKINHTNNYTNLRLYKV